MHVASPRSAERRFTLRPLYVVISFSSNSPFPDESSVDSGHGDQSPDASGRELDGMDETIFPVDYDQEGDIIDDVGSLSASVRGCELTRGVM